MPATFHRAWIVANPIAGRGRARATAAELSHGLAAAGIANEVHFTSGPGDARRFLRALPSDFDLAVAIGGDGTVSEVLDGLAGKHVPVAILPMGTANVMGLDLDLPRDAAGTIAMIQAGGTSALDTARVNREHFSFLLVGIGFDAMVVKELAARRRGPISKWSWVVPAVKSFYDYVPPALAVEVDGVALPRRYGLVIVSNVIHYGGFGVLSRDRAIDDGVFEVYLFEKSSRLALLEYAVRGLVQRLPCHGCERVRARRVRVTSEAPVPVQIDGDARGTTPVEIQIDNTQSTLVVPLQHARARPGGARAGDAAV